MEHFDDVLKALNYQIEDYQKKLENTVIGYEEKYDIELQISNRRYGPVSRFSTK